MTQQERLTCTDPNTLLAYLRGQVSDRKLRLFACACCRRIWHLLDDERCRTAAEVAERYAEGHSTRLELVAAYHGAVDAIGEVWGKLSEVGADVYGLPAAKLDAMRAAGFACREHPEPFGVEEGFEGSHTYAIFALAVSQGTYDDVIECSEGKWQADVFRDLVGNPIRPITVHPAWLTPAVVKLADAIYDERRFANLPIVADALKEAGCADADMLAHCRSEGPHVRGCWVVDLILGKQ